MYSRYIPQSDGSFRRNMFPDPTVNRPAPAERNPRETPLQKPEPPAPKPEYRPDWEPQAAPDNRQSPQTPMEQAPAYQAPQRTQTPHTPELTVQNAGDFFSRFLPKNMDTGDLLMLLILLLLLSDGTEDAPPILLTIALYFLMKNE